MNSRIDDLLCRRTMMRARQARMRVRLFTLIGVGPFGRAVARAAASLLHRTHPVLAREAHWVLITDEGWRLVSEPWTLPPSVDERKCEDGRASSEDERGFSANDALAMLHDLLPTHDRRRRIEERGYALAPGLDFCMVGHLADPLLHHIFWKIAEVVQVVKEQAGGPHVPISSSLYLAANSLSVPLVTSEAQDARATFLDGLQSQVEDSPGWLDWCYVIDVVDNQGNKLSALRRDEPGSLPQLQADVIGGFLASLYGSCLRQDERYLRLALPRLRAEQRLSADRGFVSTFGWAAAFLPISDIFTRTRDRLVLRVLNEGMLSAEKGADAAHVQSWRQRFHADLPVDPGQLRSRLCQNEAGQSLPQTVLSPNLDGVPDELVLDRILSWKALSERLIDPRRPDSALAQVSDRADEMIAVVQKWVDRAVDELVETQPRGLWLARALLRELEREVQELEPTGAEGSPERGGLIGALLRPLRLWRDPDAVPVIGPYVRSAERAMRSRLVPAAVCSRALLIALGLTACLWTALPHLQEVGAIASLLPALDPWIVGAGMIVLSLLASWLTVFLSERRIHGTQRRLIRVITRRIEISLERAAREQVRRVYPAILSALDESRSDLDKWEATLVEAQQWLKEELDSPTVGASLATEVLLPGADDLETEMYRRLERSLKDQPALEGVTLRALQAETVSPWRALGHDELIGRLRQFGAEELRDKDFLPSVTSWLTDFGELSVGEQVQRVADWAPPLQPMSQYDQPLAQSCFVGTPEAIEVGQEGPPDFDFVSTFAPSHLFVANLRCGVPLEKLPITQALQQRDEAVEQEVGA